MPRDRHAGEPGDDRRRLTPARKNSAPHTATKRIVWPRSGSATSSAAVMMRSTTASILPGTSGRRLPSAKSHAVMTMKAGLMNSEGWIDMPARKSQRREPLISSPTNSTRIISARQTKSRSSAARRTWRGVRKESPIISAAAIGA